MAEKITWTLTVQVSGGPKISKTEPLQVDAYDKIDMVITDGANDKEVQLQPGSASQVDFLLVSSDQYGADLTYKVSNVAGSAIKLDTLQLLMGEGAVGLLGAAPDKLFFSNGLGTDAAIEILIGRKATT